MTGKHHPDASKSYMDESGIVPGTADQTFEGGCHCGAVRFRVNGPLRKILICHCRDCQRLSGTSWGATAVDQANFTFTRDGQPRWYRSSDWAERGFCAECGANMFYRRDGLSQISIAPGALDSSDLLAVSGQIFAASHPAWGPIPADLPNLDEDSPE